MGHISYKHGRKGKYVVFQNFKCLDHLYKIVYFYFLI